MMGSKGVWPVRECTAFVIPDEAEMLSGGANLPTPTVKPINGREAVQGRQVVHIDCFRNRTLHLIRRRLVERMNNRGCG